MATVVKRGANTKTKMSFREALEKKRAEIEELSVRTIQVSELRYILAQTIEDESSPFSTDEQRKVPILNEEERTMIKLKMLHLIDKFFK